MFSNTIIMIFIPTGEKLVILEHKKKMNASHSKQCTEHRIYIIEHTHIHKCAYMYLYIYPLLQLAKRAVIRAQEHRIMYYTCNSKWIGPLIAVIVQLQEELFYLLPFDHQPFDVWCITEHAQLPFTPKCIFHILSVESQKGTIAVQSLWQ